MKILKFGGSSVATAERIANIYEVIQGYNPEEIALVFSAMSGITDRLIACGKTACEGNNDYFEQLRSIELQHFEAIKAICTQSKPEGSFQLEMMFNELTAILRGVYFIKELSARTLDTIVSFGERLSSCILAAYLADKGYKTEYVDARRLITTDANFGNAKVNFEITNKNIVNYFTHKKALPIITGYIGSTATGETTTLGRGGSDYTAAILGAAIHAEEIQIWTDVDGVLTADPRHVKKAFSLAQLSYTEAMEMSHFGAKVIYPPTIMPAYKNGIPLRIKNTFNPSFVGTVVTHEPDLSEHHVKGISSIAHIALITLEGSGLVGVKGISARLFGAISAASINIILITQGSSEHTITFAIAPQDAGAAQIAVNEEFELEIAAKLIEPVLVEADLSILAVIGENMKRVPGVSAKLFNALGRNGVNVIATAQGSSELNISVVINKAFLNKAVSAVHDAFFLAGNTTLNVFVIGTGLVGRTFLDQLAALQAKIKTNKNIDINVAGIANTRHQYINTDGIVLTEWENSLKAAENIGHEAYLNKIIELNLPNSILVDSTAGHQVPAHYLEILDKSISIVTPNKIGNTQDYAHHQAIRHTAKLRNVKFLYETNVGAGLPIINTLTDLLNSGDEIIRIEAILSGTLSYIFNHFDGTKPFMEVVKEAKALGYTEPDPRDDLSGLDMMRKLLILARECGHAMEAKEIDIHPILPEACVAAKTIPDFFESLTAENAFFEKIILQAKSEGKVLRYIGLVENGQAQISLQAVDSSHPFYSLSGSDNIISFTTERYKARPLVIKGPGAGAAVTAAGVLAQVVSLAE